MTRRRLLLAAVAVAVATGVGVWLAARDGEAAARPHDDPVVFLSGVVQDIAANRYEHAWQTLYPAQQLVATRDVYVRCENLSPIPGHLASLEVLRVFDEDVAVAGGDADPVASTAVTFRLKLAAPSVGAVTVTHTVHAVPVAGRWAWIMPPKRFRLYRSKSCF